MSPQLAAGNELTKRGQKCFATGYQGIGPVCWLEDLSIDAISNTACQLLRQPFLSTLAQVEDTAFTMGSGLGLSFGYSMSLELGVAYGENGEFGCYVSTCESEVPGIDISAFASMAEFAKYDTIPGASEVTSTGDCATGLGPFSAGGAAADISRDGELIGTSLSAALSAGLYETPIALGDMSCSTQVLSVD